MSTIGNLLIRVGNGLAVIGGIAFLSIFAIVLLNGSWPDFLRPVQSRFAIITQFAGSLAFIVELGLFVGPGLLVALLGQKMSAKATARRP